MHVPQKFKLNDHLIIIALALTVLSVGCMPPLIDESSPIMREGPVPEPTASVTHGDPERVAQEAVVRQIFVKAWEAKRENMISAIEQARSKWKRNEINSYSLVASKGVGGVSSPWNRSPVRITVAAGKAISLELVDKKDVSMRARTDGFEAFDTIDKLFDYMLHELKAGQIVEATYDRKLAFPKRVALTSSFATHGTRGIEISGFRKGGAETDNERH